SASLQNRSRCAARSYSPVWREKWRRWAHHPVSCPLFYVADLKVVSLPDQPHFGHLAAATATTAAGLLIPAQRQLPLRRCRLRNVELDRPYRSWLRLKRMNLHGVIGKESDAGAKVIAGVNDADLVLGRRVQTVVTHLQRRVKERFGVCAPGETPVRQIMKSHLRGLQKGGIFREALPPHQVRLARWVAQV